MQACDWKPFEQEWIWKAIEVYMKNIIYNLRQYIVHTRDRWSYTYTILQICTRCSMGFNTGTYVQLV